MTEEERQFTKAAAASGKSEVMMMAVAALVRAGRKVTIVRPSGQQTEILPFKRPAAK